MERQEIIESLRKKLFSAINRDDFEKVKEYIKEAEHRHIKNEILNNEKYSMKPMHSATYSSSHNNPNKLRYGFMVVGFVCQQRIVTT